MSADDVFVSFVESARRMLCESFQTELHRECAGERSPVEKPSWSWVCARILTCCKSYPTGVTSAIILSELYESWLERERCQRPIKIRGLPDSRTSEGYRERKQKQLLGTKVTTIDSILERKFVSLEAVLDVMIVDSQLLPGGSFLLTLGDAWSFNTIELYLHIKFNDLTDGANGILRKSREIRLTGCRLRNSSSWGSSSPRLLPTEYVIILLDEEQEYDFLLLGTKFCNDYFSNIQLNNIKAGMDYHFYARVEEIETVALQGQKEDIKQRRITLRDDNGDALPLILWNEQIHLSNLLSKGSMLAIERPSIAYELGGDNCTLSGLWFEYESHTRLYTVPCMPLPEQVTMGEPELRNITTGLNLLEPSLNSSQGQKCTSTSDLQVALPRDAQGAIDSANFLLRIVVENVQAKMSNVGLYGLVAHLSRDPDIMSVVKLNLAAYKSVYTLRIGDCTGVLDVKLYFSDQWSAGEVHVGQMVFIYGIVTSLDLNGRLECTWTEKHGGVSLVNITQLPALLSTSCLHRVVPLSKISSSSLCVQVCRVRIGSLVQHGVKYCHSCCGHPVIGQQVPGLWSCNFCSRTCDAKETVLSFFMTALLFDTYPGQKTQVYATCSGQAARGILQAEPEDFCSWSDMERGMYFYSLENEQFLVTLYSGLQDDLSLFQTSSGCIDSASLTCLRIGQALKVDPARSDI